MEAGVAMTARLGEQPSGPGTANGRIVATSIVSSATSARAKRSSAAVLPASCITRALAITSRSFVPTRGVGTA
jgi:hypothetical protein